MVVPSERAHSIAAGLIRTERAAAGGKLVHGMLRLESFENGYYWISADGRRLMRGSSLVGAEELQPSFADAMVRAGIAARK